MSFDHGVTDFQFTGAANIRLARVPDVCPICRHAVDPRRLAGAITESDGSRLQFLFQCTRRECHAMFLGYYYMPHGGSAYELSRVAPTTPLQREFPAEIQALSSNFVTIFNQAIVAESSGLDQLTGIGLRKALEFLVKDFAIAEHPSDAERIKTTPLAACIREYVADPNLSATAKRAAWLGNDETHYIRKWEDKDIRDLKVLITLAVNWMQNVLLTRKYATEMPD